MKLVKKWMDLVVNEKAIRCLNVLHELGMVASMAELARMTGLDVTEVRRFITGAKRRRSKLLHLVRYTKPQKGRQTTISITVHGRFFYHTLKVIDLPSEEMLEELAKCAVLSAKRRRKPEILPDEEGEFSIVWEDMMKCPPCLKEVSDEAVVKVKVHDIGKVVTETVKARKGDEPWPHIDHTLTTPCPHIDHTLTSTYKPYSLIAFKPLAFSDENGKNNPIGREEETQKETHKGGTERGKCPRCGQERSQFRMFTCSDPRVRAKDEQLEVWHGVVVCWACYEELNDIKWNVIERGEW